MRILAGPDGEDACLDLPLGDPASVDLRDLEVLVVESNGLLPVRKEMRGALHRAAQALQARGAKVQTTRMPALRRSLELWGVRMNAAAAMPFRTMLGEGTPISLRRELGRWMLGKSAHTLPALVLAAIDGLPMFEPPDPGPVLAAAHALREELSVRLGERGVLLYPPYTRVAPRHGWPMATPLDWIYTAIFNALELPVTQVPTGLNADGLPLGVQVVGAHGRDHVTVAVALALEQALGGWVMPTGAALAGRS
jgi:fatty acid amide hydrolase 2